MLKVLVLVAVSMVIVSCDPGSDHVDQLARALTASVNQVTPDCGTDLGTFLLKALRGESWASTMMDSYGRQESGVWTGNWVWEGRVNECQNSKAVNDSSVSGELMRGTHSIIYWWSILLGATCGIGVCLPNACTFNDTYYIAERMDNRSLVPPAFPRDKKNTYGWLTEQPVLNPSAIGAICVLSLFGFLALIGTIYDAATYWKRHPKQKKDIKKADSNGTVHVDGHLTEQGIKRLHEDDSDYEQVTYFGGSVKTSDHAGEDNLGYTTEGGAPVGNSIGGATSPGELSHPEVMANGKPHTHTKVERPTIVEVYKPGTCGELLLCFSVYTNIRDLASVDHVPGSMAAVNAVRFLAMCWIILGHTWSLGITLTSSATAENYYDLGPIGNRPTQNVIEEMDISVETFFVLSGMLTTVSFLSHVKKAKGKPRCSFFGRYFFHRYWRLTPVYMLILMFYTTLYPQLGSGPLWNPNQVDVESCRTSWWTHLIYMNNLLDSTCMGWTWYMANDFQFHVMAMGFLSLLYWVPVAGIVLTVLGFLGGWTSYIYLINGAYMGEVDWFYEIYTKPWSRCPTYFIGIFLGYAIYKTSPRPKLNKLGVVFGWLLALAAISLSVFIGWDAQKRGGWNSQVTYVAAISVQRVAFAGGVSWIVYACCKGYGGFINSLLSWRLWVPLSKLTYTGYLIHPMLLYYTYYSSPVQIFINDWNMIYYFLGTLLLTLGASFLTSLFLEVPFRALDKLMFKNVKK